MRAIAIAVLWGLTLVPAPAFMAFAAAQAAEPGRTPLPAIAIEKPGQCVEPKDVMRRDHMKGREPGKQGDRLPERRRVADETQGRAGRREVLRGNRIPVATAAGRRRSLEASSHANLHCRYYSEGRGFVGSDSAPHVREVRQITQDDIFIAQIRRGRQGARCTQVSPGWG